MLHLRRDIQRLSQAEDARQVLGVEIGCKAKLRFVGLMWGVEIVRDKRTREAFPAEMQFGIGIQNRAFENGLVCRSLGTAIAFAPPLISTLEQIDAVVSRFRDALDRSLDAYLAGGGRLGD